MKIVPYLQSTLSDEKERKNKQVKNVHLVQGQAEVPLRSYLGKFSLTK